MQRPLRNEIRQPLRSNRPNSSDPCSYSVTHPLLPPGLLGSYLFNGRDRLCPAELADQCFPSAADVLRNDPRIDQMGPYVVKRSRFARGTAQIDGRLNHSCQVLKQDTACELCEMPPFWRTPPKTRGYQHQKLPHLRQIQKRPDQS